MRIETAGPGASKLALCRFCGCALLYAVLAAGCSEVGGPPPPAMGYAEPTRTPATGPFQATGWTDASGKTVSADQEFAAKKRCAEKIVEASTDQIHVVPAKDIDDCLVKMGWKRPAAK
jgi:hypothetical protein